MPADAAALVERVQAVGAQNGPFALTLSEQELTAYLQTSLQGTPVDAATLWIEPQGIYVLASNIEFELELCGLLTLSVAEDTPRVALASATLNGRRLPRWLLASLSMSANDVLADMQRSWSIERIELEQGSARVDGAIG